MTIQTFKTEQEAIDMANDTEYGLAGAVFTGRWFQSASGDQRDPRRYYLDQLL